MALPAAGRTLRFVPIVFAIGCAATGHAAYDPVEPEGARAPIGGAPRLVADEAIAKGPLLERAAFVRAVLHVNPSIESARQAWRAAVARTRQSGVLDDPTVTLDMAPLTLGSSRARFSWDAMISQKLAWPGKLSLDEAVRSAEANAAKTDVDAALRDLALTAALLFDQYFVVARSIEINAHHVELMRAMRAAAAAQYAAGRGSAQDALQAEFELAHMEHDTVILVSQRDVTVAQMNELLHRSPREPLPPPPAALPSSASRDPLNQAQLEADAVADRPDLRAARARSRAEAARAERAARESYPDFTVSTAYNVFWDTPEQRWTVGLSFNLPVQAGRRSGAIDEANAMRAQFDADALRIRDAARTEVVVALDQLEEAEHVVHLYEARLVPVARDEVDAAQAAFVASQAPFVSVVAAEKNLRSVELEMQMASADVDRRRAELDHACGRVPGLDGAGVTP
jgi:cobalt-zinc-cadmium efflux system outer membrane protein